MLIILNNVTNAAVGEVIKYGFIDAVWARNRLGWAWMTEKGIILDYLPWEVSEPSMLKDENCVVRFSTGVWSDSKCKDKAPFECQWGLQSESNSKYQGAVWLLILFLKGCPF